MPKTKLPIEPTTPDLAAAKTRLTGARADLEAHDAAIRSAMIELADIDKMFPLSDPHPLRDAQGHVLRTLAGTPQFIQPPASPIRDQLEPIARQKLAALQAQRHGLEQALQDAQAVLREAQQTTVGTIDTDALAAMIAALESAGAIEAVCGTVPRCHEARRTAKELLHYLKQVRAQVQD